MFKLAKILSPLLMAVPLVLSATPQVEVIATGLSNPRGIAFAPNGHLYVVETGRGGSGACIVLGSGQSGCYGETGAVTRIDPTGATVPTPYVTGLPSLAPEGGFGAVGATDIAFLGNGNAQLILGLEGAPVSERDALGPKARLLGRIVQVNGSGRYKSGADIAAFEWANDPIPGPNSNGYGIAVLPGRVIVADAGANALFEVRANGAIRTLAAFQPRMVPAPPFLPLPPGAEIPMDAVPTSVVEGPDGWLYVGQLTGFPFPVGEARIHRVPPWGGEPENFAGGFSNIIDLAFDPTGTLYVLQIGEGLPPLNPPGKLIRVDASGAQTVVFSDLFAPGGLTFGPDGAAYVTNFGIVPGPVPGAFPDGGQVLRITLD